MRRDMFYFVPCDLPTALGGFERAALQKFNKQCKRESATTLSFGLNMSLRYNMNGGACHIHFLPYERGTAVFLRYSLAQAAGARYRAHCRDLVQAASAVLQMPVQEAQGLTEAQFTAYEKSGAAPAIPSGAPRPTAIPPSSPAPQPAQAPTVRPEPQSRGFCPRCGEPVEPDMNFCGMCGCRLR